MLSFKRKRFIIMTVPKEILRSKKKTMSNVRICTRRSTRSFFTGGKKKEGHITETVMP